jgi:citrate lyase subunit gamma (acyl carrier protein)
LEIKKTAVAGSLESNDILVSAFPSEDGAVKLELQSIVYKQFSEQILESAQEVLDKLGVTGGRFQLVDKGALDYTIKARMETAVVRALGGGV